MKKILKLVIGALTLLSVVSCEQKQPTVEEKFDKEINLTLKTNEAAQFKVNKNIYGTFIEFIENCIYGGIWSELVLDRKFYDPVEEGVSYWYTSGEYDIDAYTGSDAFQDNYSPILKEGQAIYQTLKALDKKDYTGYVWAKGTGKLQIRLKYLKEDSISVDIPINSKDYEKYEYKISFPHERVKIVKYEVACTEGQVAFDSISMMPADNYHGMRIDTLRELKKLNATFYRYPGGNFVSGYDFYDGLGDRDLRPTTINKHYCKEYGYYLGDEDLSGAYMAIGWNGFYGAFDPNDFGPDEFMDFCHYLDAEPNIVVNTGMSYKYDLAQMAADEVEFYNGSSSSKYGSMRAQKEPYNVRIWGAGNEMYGTWQLGYVELNKYIKRNNEICAAMKKVDPTIEIIACGEGTKWSQGLLNDSSEYCDYLSLHTYPSRQEDSVRNHILSEKNGIKYCIDIYRGLSNKKNCKGIAIDEYAYAKAEVPSRMKDGLGVASALNSMIENSDVCQIACYSSTVNATQGNVWTDDYDSMVEGSGYAISMYRNNMKEHYLPIKYDVFKAAGHDVDEYYEICATINDKKNEVCISVINSTKDTLKISCDQVKQAKLVDELTAISLESLSRDLDREFTREVKELKGDSLIVKPESLALFTVSI